MDRKGWRRRQEHHREVQRQQVSAANRESTAKEYSNAQVARWLVYRQCLAGGYIDDRGVSDGPHHHLEPFFWDRCCGYRLLRGVCHGGGGFPCPGHHAEAWRTHTRYLGGGLPQGQSL